MVLVAQAVKILPEDASEEDLDAETEPAMLVEGSCAVRQKKNSLVLLHFSRGSCNFTLDVKKPSALFMKVVKATSTDSLTYEGPISESSIALEKGKKMLLESATGRLSFQPQNPSEMATSDTMIFLMPRARSKGKKPCHAIIEAEEGKTGRITFPKFDKDNAYEAGTFCEWWIEAPEGKKIEMKFNQFDMGTASADCQNSDLIAISLSGDKKYGESTKRFCGDIEDIEKEMTSVANKVNVFGFGRDGGVGFCFTFNVIDA